MSTIQTAPLLTRITQLDRSRNVELKAYEEGGFLHGESELSLSEAAQKIAQGRPVAVEEVSKREFPVTYTQWGQKKEGVITLTQRTRTHLDSPESLEQFTHVRAGEAPSTPLEKLAARFASFEAHVDDDKKELESISGVKSGIFGGKKLEDGPGLSSFEAARALTQGRTVAVTRVPVVAMAKALLGGGGESAIRDAMTAQFVSAESDLDSAR